MHYIEGHSSRSQVVVCSHLRIILSAVVCLLGKDEECFFVFGSVSLRRCRLSITYHLEPIEMGRTKGE